MKERFPFFANYSSNIPHAFQTGFEQLLTGRPLSINMEDIMNKRTPLYERHVTLNARVAPFAGWEMPIQYEGILAEHQHTRGKASLFDTCHMGEFELSGPSAESDLERLLTQSVSSIKTGQCRYGFMLQENGGIIDDLTCYRRGSDHFVLVVNAGTLDNCREWILSHITSETTFRDLSSETAKLDIQGPVSREATESALGIALPDLKFFRFDEITIGGVSCLVSRTGYTGEWGYELYFPAEHAGDIWDRLLAGGVIKPAGLGARDTLRLEVGYPLYGHELSINRTPVAATRGRFMDMSKDFIGKDAVSHELETGVTHYLAGLQLEGRRAARASDKVWHEGREAGEITSGSLAPSLGVAVAMAYLEKDLCEPGNTLEINMRGKTLRAVTTQLPFYKHGTARGLNPG